MYLLIKTIHRESHIQINLPCHNLQQNQELTFKVFLCVKRIDIIVWAHTGSMNVNKKGFSNLSRTGHSVESPSMVDPLWNIWYWGSKWNLHRFCWDAVGCEWGTTSVYFGITYVCFIPSRLPVFAVEPQYRHQDFFIFVNSIIWRTHTKSSKNFMLV